MLPSRVKLIAGPKGNPTGRSIVELTIHEGRNRIVRRLMEEVGHPVPDGPAIDLGEVTQKGGKKILAWAVEGELDPATAVSNTFTMVWRGELREFPEVDRVAWFDVETARTKIRDAQEPFLDRLLASHM